VEGELVDRPSVLGAGEENSALSYTKMFWESLPYYLAIGMTYEEFWNCDPRLYKVYRELYQTKKQQENERLWLQGMYTYQAILLCAPRLNSIKPKKPEKYPKEPFDITAKAVKKEEAAGLDIMKAWMERVNKHYG